MDALSSYGIASFPCIHDGYNGAEHCAFMRVRIEARPGIDYNKCGIQIHKPGEKARALQDITKVDITFSREVAGHQSWADPEGGGGQGSAPPRNCQIINFCHVEIFRQTPSGNLDPQTMFWIRACQKR